MCHWKNGSDGSRLFLSWFFFKVQVANLFTREKYFNIFLKRLKLPFHVYLLTTDKIVGLEGQFLLRTRSYDGNGSYLCQFKRTSLKQGKTTISNNIFNFF